MVIYRGFEASGRLGGDCRFELVTARYELVILVLRSVVNTAYRSVVTEVLTVTLSWSLLL